MKIEFVPSILTPVDEGLLFGFSTERDTPEDVEIEIIDADNDTVVGVQKLYQVTEGVVNISPYVTRFTEREPCVGKWSFITFNEVECAHYKIRVGGVESDTITISPLRCKPSPVEVVSKMPAEREISYGECDEVVICAEPDDEVEVSVSYRDGSVSFRDNPESGLMHLVVIPDYFDDDVPEMSVEFMINGKREQKMHYKVVPKSKRALRLAWVAESGVIEHYTFPMVCSLKERAVKERIGLGESLDVASLSVEKSIKVVSNYESRSVVEALADIISSPAVWVEADNEAHKVDVLTSEIEYNAIGSLDRVALEVRLKRGECAL